MIEYPHESICEQLAFFLIRPPRLIYNPSMLALNEENRLRFTMETVDIGFPLTLYRQKSISYMLLYLHRSGSCSYEGNLFLQSLPDDVGLACFDFDGCGNRYDSDFITLGLKECKDVDVAARYLKRQGYRVAGWGRSMGGVSLLRSSEIEVMVCDSAFSNLSELCK